MMGEREPSMLGRRRVSYPYGQAGKEWKRREPRGACREEGNANSEPMRKRLRPSLEGRLGNFNRALPEEEGAYADPNMPAKVPATFMETTPGKRRERSGGL